MKLIQLTKYLAWMSEMSYCMDTNVTYCLRCLESLPRIYGLISTKHQTFAKRIYNCFFFISMEFWQGTEFVACSLVCLFKISKCTRSKSLWGKAEKDSSQKWKRKSDTVVSHGHGYACFINVFFYSCWNFILIMLQHIKPLNIINHHMRKSSKKSVNFQQWMLSARHTNKEAVSIIIAFLQRRVFDIFFLSARFLCTLVKV